MCELFAPFERMAHHLEHCVEIANSDRTSLLTVRWICQIWIKGNKRAEPDVAVSTMWIAMISPIERGGARDVSSADEGDVAVLGYGR
jgi:hypothetical protein